MKKTIVVILVVVILATMLAGCGANPEASFRKDIETLKNYAKTNVDLFGIFLNYEAEYMKTSGITDDQHESEVATAGSIMYEKTVEQLKAEGKNTSAVTLDSISDRLEKSEKLWEKINGNAEGRAKYPELYQQAATLYTTQTTLEGLTIGPYGPGDKFGSDCEKLVKLAKDTISEIERLLND